jgi:hypothetical protein
LLRSGCSGENHSRILDHCPEGSTVVEERRQGMEAASAGALLFQVSEGDLVVSISVDELGRPSRFSYRSGEETREFLADEIGVAATEVGTLTTVLLESGAADAPIVRFSVVLPVVNPGGEERFPTSVAAFQTTESSGFGGPRPGPMRSYEATTLEGTVARADAYATISECRDWIAIHDLEPPGPGRLVVTGTCTFPRAGYAVELRRHEPQGINREDVLLDKIVTEPTGPTALAITDVPVRYEEETQVAYRTVTIIPDGPTIEVQKAL